MKQCTFCGAELQDDARACNNCGRPVPDMPEPEEKKVTASIQEADPETQESNETEQPAQNAAEQSPNPWGTQEQLQNPWGQPQGRQDMQNPWGQPQGRQDMQNPWGQPQGRQDMQNPWGQPQSQQDPQPQQTPWGWQQNDPANGNYGGQYPNFGGQYPPYGYPQNGQMQRYNAFALWSLVFGLLASFLNGLIFIPSVIAIVFGIIGIVQTGKNPGMFRGKWMAVAGLIFGVFFLIIYGYVFRMVFQAVQNPETFQQLQQYLQEINAGGR